MNAKSESLVSSPPTIKHVLIVDEQEMIRTVVASLLQSWGFTTRTACSLIGACRVVVSDGPFDTIICKYDLPDGNAFDLIKWMQEQQLDVPTIVPYGAQRPVEEHRAVVKLLPIPFDPAELRNAIEHAGRDGASRSARPATHKKALPRGNGKWKASRV